jgi:hyperosmotically inducible protein
MMKHLILASMLAAGVAVAPLVFADVDSGAAPDSSHHFVKDSVITTKVKSKLASKHLTTLTRIKVDTDENGVVWLSGRAPNQDAVDLATELAKSTEGVTDVHNDVAVQPKP